MVKKFVHRQKFKKHIKADVIILGCSLPGIVTAHNLKMKFGDTVDIVVLDLTAPKHKISAHNKGISVAFQDLPDDDSSDEEPEQPPPEANTGEPEKKPIYDNIARFFLNKYSTLFNLPVPDYLDHQKVQSPLSKLFQDLNGKIFKCKKNYHEFDYLTYVEKFELLQYQTLLDSSMQNLFQPYITIPEGDKERLQFFDHTTMEAHMSQNLYSSNSKDIMRTIVELVCGTRADKTSVLFFLHQCHRVSTSRNIIDGDDVRFREKLLGHFRKRLAHRLHESIADITLSSKPIKEIRTAPDEFLILEPEIGETDYICRLLAMALRPDQLRDIVIETDIINENQMKALCAMEYRPAKKFIIEYKSNFWQPLGFSGDILSIRGPIVWAMERPLLTTTRSADKYAALVGFLKLENAYKDSSKEEVIDQLVSLFGQEAANPVSYSEITMNGICIPRLEEYVILRKLATESNPKCLEWGALDIFAEGDVASALEAGHIAYIHLLSVLRPQAVTYEDIACGMPPAQLYDAIDNLSASVNVLSTSRVILYCLAVMIAFGVFRRLRQ